MEEEWLAVLTRLRAQRKTLAEQIAEAAKFLAETDRHIAELEQGWVGRAQNMVASNAAEA